MAVTGLTHLGRRELEALAVGAAPPCVTIFVPTERAGPPTQQAPIRLKNLLGEAEKRLIASGRRPAEVRAFLDRVDPVLHDDHFWRAQADGLAMFLAPDFFRAFRVPLHLEEGVFVGERFHVKPLLPLVTGNGRFYVLAISQDEVRLFEATRDLVSEIDLRDTPRSIDEAIGGDPDKSSPRFHIAATEGAGPGRRRVMFHGHGLTGDQSVAKREIAKYFELVDGGIRGIIGDDGPPLILAGVEYTMAIYREHTKYGNVVDESIPGNPDGLSVEQLHEEAWRRIEPHFLESRRSAAERLRSGLPHDRATDRLESVFGAALDGRVRELFVAVDERLWGRFDEDARRIRVVEEPGPEDEDLLDRAALIALSRAGDVYAVPRAEMPVDAPLAAVFRY